MPSTNKFLIDTATPTEINEKQVLIRKLYTPTPTRRDINEKASNYDPIIFWNQLSHNRRELSRSELDSPFI